MEIKRYTRGKFGRIEESTTGEFVYYVEAEKVITSNVELYVREREASRQQHNSAVCEVYDTLRNSNRLWKDLVDKEVLTSKKLRIGMWLALSSATAFGLLFLQANGVI